MNTLKAISLVMLWVGVVSGTGVASTSGPETGAQAQRRTFVEHFMTLMVERQQVNSAVKSELDAIDAKMLSMLAPYYFETIGVDKGTLTVNKYSPEGYRVVLVDNDYVYVKLLRKVYAGPTIIVFKTAEYQGRIFIEPSGVSLAGKGDPSLVTPWFYAAGPADVNVEEIVLPKIIKAGPVDLRPATKENALAEGVAMVKKLLNYVASRSTLKDTEKKGFFQKEILPLLAEGYTAIYGVDLTYFEDIATDEIKSYKISDVYDSYVVVDCGSCLYNRYYFKIVVEAGKVRVMPSGIDNYRKTISPIWLKE